MALNYEYLLTLQLLDGIGNKTIFKIIEQISVPIDSVEQLCEFWVSLKGKKFQNITPEEIIRANKLAKHLISEAEENEVGIISFFDANFPDQLRQCKDEKGKLDPPLILFYRGNLKVMGKKGLAIIGTREPTENGKNAGLFFSEEFAKRGFNIISGLAVGCDTTAHFGALNVNGATTAFLATGLDWESIYPKENLDLAKEIVSNGGLLLSEYPVGSRCGVYSLVARDRLQAGLANATLVIQTGVNGGTMHAVNATIASDKPLFSVHFKNDEDRTHEKVQGNLFLIQEKGAFPLRSNGIDSAISIINNACVQKVKLSQPSLFD
ncbi:MAG: DNA-processing protein DprA [Bacteroidales bacterium]|nr:DNA-processing protein DprA [Bacteroidales bacterium]